MKYDELRSDFNSFTVDISKWQIDTDRRIADAENDISGKDVLSIYNAVHGINRIFSKTIPAFQ